jgi:hypothetical protein
MWLALNELDADIVIYDASFKWLDELNVISTDPILLDLGILKLDDL